ncbi:Hypothetical protein CINCED_3A021217 [Cinara cedri]|uniref:Uncharacterized protein n=1 Tax=Cinara cedri TaxID=506608 RepID=A0A5E4MEE1_9HEMI|nr:Hypothetical protein CINCED_3A021217 [Cinara cedri]
MLLFRKALHQNISEVSNVKELVELLIAKNNCNDTECSGSSYSFKTAQRSFPKLKLVKHCLRSSMAQARLTNLNLQSIENERIRSLNINTLVEKFATKNARSQKFIITIYFLE